VNEHNLSESEQV